MEKKIALKMESLVVESFELAEPPAQRGTVQGNENTTFRTCPSPNETCNGNLTCWDGCTGGIC